MAADRENCVVAKHEKETLTLRTKGKGKGDIIWKN